VDPVGKDERQQSEEDVGELHDGVRKNAVSSTALISAADFEFNY
jgi:hypothetical protein